MINLQQELRNYSPIDLNSLLERNPSIPDNIRNSVVLYNKALESLRTGSEDIAVIELKKAVAMNPDFHEAMNLLGICYSYMNDNEKAAEMFEKVIKAEDNSIRALKYMSSINQGEQGASDAREKRKRTAASREPKLPERKLSEPKLQESEPSGFRTAKRPNQLFSELKNSNELNKAGLIKLFTGFAAGILVAALIAVPVFMSITRKPAEADPGENEGNDKAATEVVDPYKSKYESLNKDFAQLQEQLLLANKEIDYYKNTARLHSVDGLISAKKYEAAADLLVELRPVQFRDPEKEKFEALQAAAIPKALSAVYSEGNRLFNSKNYQEAVDKLVKIPVYADDWSYMDSSLYLLGKAYAALNDTKNAAETFQKVIDNYPDSDYATWSASRLKGLTQAN